MNKNEQIVLARARELVKLAQMREYEFVCSKFLSPAEQAEYNDVVNSLGLGNRCFFYGGAIGADRRVCAIVPSFIEVPHMTRTPLFSKDRERILVEEVLSYAPDENFGITPLKIKGSTYVELSHRAYMGSILGLGLERDVVGDIVPNDAHCATVFVSDVIVPFLCENLQKVARDTVKVSKMDLEAGFEIEKKFATVTIIAASARADAVVAGITGASRSVSKEMCLSGLVDINYKTSLEADAEICEGDTVSVRGYGKFLIDSFSGETRSGRMRILARKYS